MKKARLALLLAVPVLIGTIFVLAYSVLHTTTGARWLLSLADGRIPGSLEMSKLNGDLSSGLTISHLIYRTPDLEISADQIRAAINLDFFPFVLRVTEAHIEPLRVNQLQNDQLSASPPATWLDETLSSLALPISIELEDLALEQILVSDPDGQVLFSGRLGARLGLGKVLRIDHLFSEAEWGRTDLSGELQLTRPYSLQSALEGQFELATTDGAAPLEVDMQLKLDGDLESQLRLIIDSKQPAITVQGALHNLIGDPRWQLEANADQLNWPPEDFTEPDFGLAGLTIESQGWVDGFELSANSKLQSGAPEDLDLTLQGEGDLSALTVRNLVLSGLAIELRASGDLAWQDGLDIRMSAILDHLDPVGWLPEWPHDHPVSGRLDFNLRDGDLELPGFHFELANTIMSVDGKGHMVLPDGAVTADLGWKNLQWPLVSPEPDIKSPVGMMQLSGIIDDWTIDGEADFNATGLPAGKLKLEAWGNRDRAMMTSIDGRILGGEIAGTAEYDWSDNGRWSAELKGSRIETETLFPDWPANFSADFRAQGQTTPFSLQLEIRQLEGELKDLPLSARGGLNLQDGEPSFDHLNLSFGESKIALHGQPMSADGLDFSAQTEDVSSIIPDGTGSVQASGQFSLLAEQPRLQLDLEGENLSWQGNSLQSISIHDHPNRPADALAAMYLEMTGLDLGAQSLESASLKLLAGPETQSLLLEAQGSGLTLSTELTGGFQDPGKSMLVSPWTGQLSSFALNDGESLKLALKEPAAFVWSTESASLENACLASRADDSLCLNAAWQDGKRYSASLQSTRVPLSLLQSLLDIELKLTQTIDGEIDWSWDASNGPSGSASLEISPGELRPMEEHAPPTRTGAGQISFILEADQLSAGKFYLPLPGVGEVNLDLGISNVSAGLEAGVEGQLNLALSDLYVLTLFLPVFDQTSGELTSKLDLSGTIGRPWVNGSLAFADGLIRHQPSGLTLHDIQLSGQILNNKKTTFGGSFRAVEGTGELEASLDLTDPLSPDLEISLRGENLKLFDSPELSLIAEPDILLRWQAGTLDIDGKILIPEAHIAPRYIPSAVVSESPDLVIVAGKPPDTVQTSEQEKDFAIRGSMEVTLGEEVTLDLGLAQTELTGSTLFEWRDELIPVATGQYRIVGQINAFGQRLQISEGIIGFPTIPANNPHLNIRAEREIFGNSEIRRAGVFISGTLSRFTAEPYTQPMTDRERARTLLITGSDFNMDQGVGAVDIGTYIAPRVFVSYGYGVFDNDHIVSIRYDLGRGWGVKATSGQRQTGLDISYTIER